MKVLPSFNAVNDCQINWNVNSCAITFVQSSSFLKVTIKGSATYLAGTPNIFPYTTYTTIYLRNIYFSVASTNNILYPVYMTLFKSDVVNPTAYYFVRYDLIYVDISVPCPLSMDYQDVRLPI